MPVKPLSAQPPAVPIGVPSQLLERRPDIASAERAAAEANALIGIGKAAYYPSVTLSGSAAIAATTLSQLVTGPAGVWSLGASLAQTLIDHGARKATVQQYEAQYRAAVASYRQTVLVAFREVEDNLASSRELAVQVAQQQQAVDASTQYRDLAMTRYQTGVDTYLNVLTAQNTLLGNQQTIATLRTNQMVTSVQLIAALGGGWSAKPGPSGAF
jgi:NodT family efflux transporter outer membrane factor (OMF) lipoprotein